ncbi:MAG TPA: triose-phosphate isomerase, partial [Thermoplasmata archaeon]|nr:triose-phosphate isomerase [Thermoplasmata archaeon]
KAVELARVCAKVEEDTGRSLAVAPSAFDLALVAKSVRLPVFAQHLDPIETGKSTGWLPPEAALAAGAVGTIVNHSERKVAWEELRDVIRRCHTLGLEVVACADDVAEAETAAKLGPDYLAIEPPELIGGDVSVTTAKPEIITRAVDRIRATNSKVQVLCGAGVKTGRDVARALELGTVGVLLASGVVKAKNPEKALRDLAKGLVREA